MSKLNEDQKKVFPQKWNTFFPNSGKDHKKKVFSKNGTLFPRNSSGHLRSDAHQSQISGGGDADVDHAQTIGEDTVKLLTGYIPPSPPGYGTSGFGNLFAKKPRRFRLAKR